ncbi:hypothetical protein F5B18DRAFT_537780 [Nemania serpens]|nr:hypothetical protein F5B18DRAFT_537780 [Nemania serpens]
MYHNVPMCLINAMARCVQSSMFFFGCLALMVCARRFFWPLLDMVGSPYFVPSRVVPGSLCGTIPSNLEHCRVGNFSSSLV